MPSAPSLRIDYRPSRWQRTLSVVLIVLAALALLLAPWPAWLRIVVLALYVAGVVFVLRRLRGPGWRSVAWSSDGAWTVTLDDAVERPATLHEARLFGPLTALRLDVGTIRVRIPLWPDSAGADDLRRLRIRLAREGGRAPDAAQ